MQVLAERATKLLEHIRASSSSKSPGKTSSIPYTIVRATQFFEFVGAIAESATEAGTVRLPPARMQPILSDDVAAELADVAEAEPLNGIVDLAGPEPIPMDELVRRFLRSHGDDRQVVTDADARYFGTTVDDQTLTPGGPSRIGPTRFEQWLSQGVSRA